MKRNLDLLQSPIIKMNPNVKSVFDFRYEDFKLVGYESPDIKVAKAA